ncbi:hypothetical protein EHQ57_10100 [Leptospira wolffii]|uniref:hypothetical protein n=1 Tax=Leptospira wolffii TaxID=409998 RepID=UPI00108413D7|nr:hypothetical protein [Leptospira wolffii]TGK71443.1 hypothetical protein EHQ35_15055 [Leptospira wolffii]TGL29280.1 hypothetical protein EHQ57_10100 [Leptospira wolffii]
MHQVLRYIYNQLKIAFDKTNWVLNSLNSFASSHRVTSYFLTISVSFLFGIPFIKFIYNIVEYLNTETLLSNKTSILSDCLGLIGTIIGVVSYINQKRNFFELSLKFSSAFRVEFQKISSILDSLEIDSDDPNFIKYLEVKLKNLYIDLFNKYEDFYIFGLNFYQDFAYFIAKYYNLSDEKRIFLQLNIFAYHFKIRHKYIETIKNADYFSQFSVYAKALLLYQLYVQESRINLINFDTNQLMYSEEEIKNLYQDIISSESSTVVKLMDKLKEEKISNHLLENVLNKSYSILGTENRKKKIITSPCLIIKNEESFDSWWTKVEKQARIAYKLRNPNATEEEISSYSIRAEISNEDSKQPFSTSLNNDDYIRRFLDHNKHSPVYIVDPNNLPLKYRGKPIEYINIEVKRKAKLKQDKLLKKIRSLEPKIQNIEKELSFDFELIPFDIEKIEILTRHDKIPRSVENIFLQNYISKENRGKFIQAHVLQIKSILNNVSPFSLIVKSIPEEIKSKLFSIEIDFLSKIEKKKFITKNFEGINNILSLEAEKNNLAKLFFESAKAKKINLTKQKCNEILSEIFINAASIKKTM